MTGTFLVGWLSDFIGRQRAQALSSFITVCGIAILLLIPHLSTRILMGWLFVLVYGIGLGGMSVCHSSMSADAFKGPSFGATIGLLEIFFGLGGLHRPPADGLHLRLDGKLRDSLRRNIDRPAGLRLRLPLRL